MAEFDLTHIYVFSFAVMMFDSLYDSLKFNVRQAFKLYCPVVIAVVLFFAYTSLPCYNAQRGLILLLVNYVLANIIWNLMIHHMTKQPFSSIMQPSLILLIVPLVAYHCFDISGETERLLPQISTALAFLIFFWKMIIVAK